MPWWESKNTTYMSDLRALQKEKVSYVFFSNLCKNSNWLKVIYFNLFYSSTAQSFMVDTLNPTVQVWLGEV
jgi:hypothetical protein